MTTLALSGFLGLVIGGGLAYLAEMSDKSFRSIEEVRQRLGLTVIGQVPALTAYEPSVIEENPLAPFLYMSGALAIGIVAMALMTETAPARLARR